MSAVSVLSAHPFSSSSSHVVLHLRFSSCLLFVFLLAAAIRYQATHSTQTVFTEKEVEAIIQRLTFADKPASSGLGGAGATA